MQYVIFAILVVCCICLQIPVSAIKTALNKIPGYPQTAVNKRKIKRKGQPRTFSKVVIVIHCTII